MGRISRGTGVLVWCGTLALGCAAPLGALRVTPEDANPAVKLLVRDAEARACGIRLLGMAVGGQPSLDGLVDSLLAQDPEADAVVDAVVTLTSFPALIAERRCLSVRGHLARSIRSISLPGPHH